MRFLDNFKHICKIDFCSQNLIVFTPKLNAQKFSYSFYSRIKNNSHCNIAIFSSTSIFLLWLSEITHIRANFNFQISKQKGQPGRPNNSVGPLQQLSRYALFQHSFRHFSAPFCIFLIISSPYLHHLGRIFCSNWHQFAQQNE